MTIEPKPSRTWKIELHRFVSATLTDRQFLTGKSGLPLELTAALRLPPPQNGPYPGAKVAAVVLLHGSGGASGHVDEWAQFLTDRGIASLLVDSFTARGLDTTFANPESLGRLAMIVDAYRAFDLLAQHPRIDADRVALIGFSRGGQAALYAAVKRFHDLHGPRFGSFAGYFAFYPACHICYRDDEHLVDRPVAVLHGDADDMNPIEPCREYVARIERAGGRIRLHELAGARHVFDWPLLSQPVVLPGVKSNRGALLEERADGAVFVRGTDIPASAAQFELNPTLAHDAAALTVARQLVWSFVEEVSARHA